ncbi:hypothetical protein KGF57_002214, partial [Candida theae]
MSYPFTGKNVSLSKGPDPKTSIQTEREAQKFNPQAVNYFLEGSKYRSELVQTLTQQMERDPILFTDGSYYDMTKNQQRESTAAKINRLSRYLEGDSPETFMRRLSLLMFFDPAVGTRIGINLILFLHCVKGNGTRDQVKYWTSDKFTDKIRGIYGCF